MKQAMAKVMTKEMAMAKETMMEDAIRIHKNDLVAVALNPLKRGQIVMGITLSADVPEGHKFALSDLAKGSLVIKYGHSIGRATADIKAGDWVHTHNVRTDLTEKFDYRYAPKALLESASIVTPEDKNVPELEFKGYLRADGSAGIRNELWIIPTVGCVNDICKTLEQKNAKLVGQYGLDGLFHFSHPHGCSQLGDDHEATCALLAALCRHPNAGGVLVVGLGCENNTLDEFRSRLSPEYSEKLRFMECQQETDELEAGRLHLEALAAHAALSKRQTLPVSKLIIGMKCGGSDGLSGITANPVAGIFCDKLISMGATAILTEVPEMFGAEQLLFDRCKDIGTFNAAVDMIDRFKDYFISHGQTIYENPSPGNKAGGITTLEDKSLGCVQKGGSSPIVAVLDYAQQVTMQGLNLLYGPGNDLVSATALVAAGAQIVLFTTGRGTPFGAPAPTLKISTNNDLAARKPHWIDFNAGTAAQGEEISDTANRLLKLVVEIANGTRMTRSEEYAQRGIAIWKNGVTL